jgi:biopolymer transport protein ExbB/TolQ
MFRYFIEGGPFFMGLLTIVLLVILVIGVVNGAPLLTNSSSSNDQHIKRLGFMKSLGLFAFVLGMLGQFLGLFQAFDIISSGMEILPAIMAQGVKISMVTSIYGMIIFLIAYLLWFILKSLADRKSQA